MKALPALLFAALTLAACNDTSPPAPASTAPPPEPAARTR